MPKFKPVFNNILVTITEDESDIVIPEEAKNEPVRGQVVEVGTGTSEHPLQVHPSMFVWFDKRDAKPISLEGETHYVVDQRDLLLVEEQ